jgi:hypothetical protein
VIVVRLFTARVYTDIKYCDCPRSEVGKILPASEHSVTCRFRKNKTVDIKQTPDDEFGGYSLGIPTN